MQELRDLWEARHLRAVHPLWGPGVGRAMLDPPYARRFHAVGLMIHEETRRLVRLGWRQSNSRLA